MLHLCMQALNGLSWEHWEGCALLRRTGTLPASPVASLDHQVVHSGDSAGAASDFQGLFSWDPLYPVIHNKLMPTECLRQHTTQDRSIFEGKEKAKMPGSPRPHGAAIQ